MPTTYIERFTEAVRLLCGKEPPRELVVAWLEHRELADDLQNFAAQYGPSWAQGIVVLDAAAVLADTPEEGAEHEPVYGQRQAQE